MPRTYTQRTIVDGNINLSDNINFELDGALQEFNGKLDANQMPLLSVGSAKLRDSIIYSASPVDGSQGPCNAYYISEDSSILSPWEWDYTAGEWEVGWNPFYNKMTSGAGSQLTFPAKEGIIKGSVVCDVERRTYKRVIPGDTPVTTEWSTDNWIEIGVFVNDRLVAQTGKQYTRRFTYDLPFASYVGNEEVTVDIRWRAVDVPVPITNTGYVPQPFYVHGSLIWARNQYR